jgi:hypothetical protein
MRFGSVVSFVAALMLAVIAAAPARADGTVLRATGCGGRIFVSSVTGYSMLTGTGTEGVRDGDALIGKVDTIGYTELYDRTRGFNFSASIEERNLDRSEIAPRIAIACRSLLQNGLTTGTVVRGEGCRGRIFVSGPAGYAVLQRLAGGIVGKDDELSGDFNKPGRATVKDKQTGSVLTVFVEDYQLSRAAADRKMAGLCSANQ